MKKIVLFLLFPILAYAQVGIGLKNHFSKTGNLTVSGTLQVDSVLEKTSGHGIDLGAGTMKIDQTNGRVGIGTTTPVTALNVSGDITIGDSTTAVTNWTIYFPTDGNLTGEYIKWNDSSLSFEISDDIIIPSNRRFYSGSMSITQGSINDAGNELLIHGDSNENGAGTIRLRVTSIDAMYINSTGNIGIGTTSPDSATLQIASGVGAHDLWLGDATTYSYADAGDQYFTYSSSRNLKENIRDFSGVDLSKFSQVKPKLYNFKKSKLMHVFKPKFVAGWDTLSALDRGKKQVAWMQKESKRAARLAKKQRLGFLAEDIGLLEGKLNKEKLNSGEVIAIMWLKIQELEKRIEVLEQP